MKIVITLIIILLFIFSCRSIEEGFEEIPKEKKIELDIPEISVILEIVSSEEIISFDESNYTLKIDPIFPVVDYEALSKKTNLPENPILRLIELKKLFFQYNEIKESEFPDNEVTSIYFDGTHYYIGTLRGGVFQYNIHNSNFLEIKKPYNSLFNISITGLYKTNDYLLISSYSGLYTYNFKNKKLIYESESMVDKSILSLNVTNGKILIGTVDGYLIEWKNQLFIEKLHLNGNSINTISNINGFYFLGTSRQGILKYSDSSQTIESFNQLNRNMTDKKIKFITYFDNKYWIGALSGELYIFDLDFNLLKSESSLPWILSTGQSENYIYFGTHSDGLWFYDKILGIWDNWGIENGLSSLYIPSLYIRDNQLFISTPGKGIVIIDEQIHEQKF